VGEVDKQEGKSILFEEQSRFSRRNDANQMDSYTQRYPGQQRSIALGYCLPTSFRMDADGGNK
jgi:hypothetical protein